MRVCLIMKLKMVILIPGMNWKKQLAEYCILKEHASKEHVRQANPKNNQVWTILKYRLLEKAKNIPTTTTTTNKSMSLIKSILHHLELCLLAKRERKRLLHLQITLLALIH